MKIEIDLEKIKLIGKQKEDENWKFRSYLKGLNIEEEELDKIVHEINNDVTSQIDCTKCANCCKVFDPILDSEDVVKLSASLNMKVDEFKTSYLIESKEEMDCYNFNKVPCPFLMDNKCSVYPNRPKVCESYPHLHKEEFWTRLMGVVQNYSICPIVFNVYERLKKELWRKNWRTKLE
jgi:Fe-S-cluster containining protein